MKSTLSPLRDNGRRHMPSHPKWKLLYCDDACDAGIKEGKRGRKREVPKKERHQELMTMLCVVPMNTRVELG